VPNTTTLTTTLFTVLVLVMAIVTVAGLRRAGVGFGPVAGILLIYLAVPAVLARSGALDRYSPLPAPALLVLLALTVTTAVLVFSYIGAKVALALPIAPIVLLQAFRIGVEFLLHRLYLEGAVPVEMTWSGRNFDIISGLTGLGLGLWLMSGRSTPGPVIFAWNLMGLGLLLNIVIVAILATPVPFRQFTDGPPNLLPSTFPFIWLPSFLVQMALASHLLIFRQLRKPALD
jgi:hypothetical protein